MQKESFVYWKRVFPARKKFRLVPLSSKWPSSHPHDLVHMANLNCMFDQVFFSGLGVEVNIQFIIRSMHHTVYILTSLVNFVPKTSKKLAFSIKFALFLSPSFLCSFSCALPLSYVFLSKDLSRKQVEKAKRACRSHMTHTLQSCDKEWKKRGQKCGREYKWALVLVMWRGYMFLSTQRFLKKKS